MPGKKKKFIDKKNAVTFSLVHRSQRDPLQADEESSKFVLQQVENSNDKSKTTRREEQAKYGVYYDDDYDYLQHLREVDAENAWELQKVPGASSGKTEKKVHFEVEDLTKPDPKPRLQLPADVFPSEQEEDVGLLNRAAPISGPRLDLDPDIVAAMDDDFDFGDPDNELEDDFIAVAQGEEPLAGSRGHDVDSDDEEGEDDEDDDDDEEGEDYDSDELDDLDQRSFSSEETKSRFTNYSMTSSVMRRNEGLTLLDDRFEKIYEEYDDMEIGALDQDEIEGYVPDESEVLKQVISEFELATKVTTMNDIETERIHIDGDNVDDDDDEEEEEEEEKEEKIKLYIEEKKERWDCESILSTYSSLYNHPTTIKEPVRERRKKKSEPTDAESSPIRLSQKTGMPLGVLPSQGPTKKQLERLELDETRLPQVTTTSRQKGVKETPEEKRARKQAVQMARKERRIEKKANKQAFKEEEIRQGKVMKNVRQNLQGVKIV